MGIKSIQPVDEKDIIEFSQKYKIPLADSYELDKSYVTFIKSLDTILYASQKKNHSQPLQALYYEKNGQLKSFQINCYAGGFPNLNWNRNEILTTFPPLQQAPLDSVLPLNNHLKFLRPLSTKQKFSIDDFDYIVIVYWSRFMGRQSKRLIHFVQDNCKLATDKNVKVIYANTDNFFALLSSNR
jgi:hypothetical protein